MQFNGPIRVETTCASQSKEVVVAGPNLSVAKGVLLISFNQCFWWVVVVLTAAGSFRTLAS